MCARPQKPSRFLEVVLLSIYSPDNLVAKHCIEQLAFSHNFAWYWREYIWGNFYSPKGVDLRTCLAPHLAGIFNWMGAKLERDWLSSIIVIAQWLEKCKQRYWTGRWWPRLGSQVPRSQRPQRDKNRTNLSMLSITYPSIFIFAISFRTCFVWLGPSAVIHPLFYLIRIELFAALRLWKGARGLPNGCRPIPHRDSSTKSTNESQMR